jgi:LacI family transcriptional regulator
MKKISLKDIALLSGASPSTVSFVLNGKEKEMRISEKLAKKIRAVASREGYKPNPVAVSLRTGQSKILGLIVESIGGNFFGALAKVIEHEAEKYGYRIVYCSTENDLSKGREMIRMLSNSQVDGYLITPVQGLEKDIEALIKQNNPLVLIDGYFPGVTAPYVLVNNKEGVTKGMTHLISKGYKNIAFVTVDIDLIHIREREEAYITALRNSKLPFKKSLIFRLKYGYDKRSGVESLSGFFGKHPGVDAVFFATNYLGITGLQSLKELGLRIPQDIGMICFDDHDVFGLYPPGISSIKQPVEEIGKAAIHLLLRQLAKQRVELDELHIQIDSKLIERGST